MKIVITIPKINWGVRPWYDKLVKALTYEVDKIPDDSFPKATAPSENNLAKTATTTNTSAPKQSTQPKSTRIQIQTEDLPLISTALIRYKKHLKQSQQLDKAQRVGELDQVFYEIIILQKNANQQGTVLPTTQGEQMAQAV